MSGNGYIIVPAIAVHHESVPGNYGAHYRCPFTKTVRRIRDLDKYNMHRFVKEYIFKVFQGMAGRIRGHIRRWREHLKVKPGSLEYHSALKRFKTEQYKNL